jgi:hypothetical protein
MRAKITADHLERTALVYVRQSTAGQVRDHTESRRRQYGLVDVARELGFRRVETIDDDLGISGSGLAERPGFNDCSRPSARARRAPCWRSKRRAWCATIATGHNWWSSERLPGSCGSITRASMTRASSTIGCSWA